MTVIISVVMFSKDVVFLTLCCSALLTWTPPPLPATFCQCQHLCSRVIGNHLMCVTATSCALTTAHILCHHGSFGGGRRRQWMWGWKLQQHVKLLSESLRAILHGAGTSVWIYWIRWVRKIRHFVVFFCISHFTSYQWLIPYFWNCQY